MSQKLVEKLRDLYDVKNSVGEVPCECLMVIVVNVMDLGLNKPRKEPRIRQAYREVRLLKGRNMLVE